MFPRRFRAASAFGVIALAGVALTPAPARGDGADEVVVTGTRTPERAQRAAVRTDVVSREEALRRGALSVADALASQPGLQVTREGSLGGAASLQMQGFDRERVLILEDGERIVGDMGGVTDLGALPIADVERIEIVNGPASALYGANAIGGVVNVVPAAPRREGFSGSGRAEGRSQPAAAILLRGAHRQGTTWAVADGSILAAASRDDEQGGATRVPATRRGFVGVRAGVALSERLTLRARVRVFRDEAEARSEQVVPGLGTYPLRLPTTTDRFASQLVEEVRIGRAGLLRVALAAQGQWGESRKEREGSAAREARRRHHRLYSAEATFTGDAGPVTLVGGARLEAEHASLDLTRTRVLADESVARDAVVEMPAQTFGSLATYAQGSARLGPSFTVLAGARLEHHTRYGGAGAPRLAVAWQATDALMVRASAGRGFRAPSAKELGFAFDHAAFGYRVDGNPDLAPETSWGINTDAALRPRGSAVTLRASAFATWVDNLIEVDLAGGTVGGGVAAYTYRNVGRARTAGATAEARWAIARWLAADIAYTYLWTRNDAAGEPLAGRPPHTVVASLRAELPGGVSLYLRERLTTGAYLDGQQRTPASLQLDARVTVRPGGLFELYAGLLNALGEQQDPARVGDLRSPLGRVAYAGIAGNLPWEETP